MFLTFKVQAQSQSKVYTLVQLKVVVFSSGKPESSRKKQYFTFLGMEQKRLISLTKAKSILKLYVIVMSILH